METILRLTNKQIRCLLPQQVVRSNQFDVFGPTCGPPPPHYIKYNNTLRQNNFENVSGSTAAVPTRPFWIVVGFCCYIETLNIEGMKRLWDRKISDLAFYQFIEILKFKSIKHDRQLIQIGQWTATTKPCSDCGHRNDTLELNDRQWTYQKCGSHHDRDVHAAINISQAG